MSYEEFFKVEIIKAFDKNSYIPFLRNEISKIFENLFMIKQKI